VLSIEEVASVLNVSTDDVNEVIKNGELPFKKIGSKILISIENLVRFINGEITERTVSTDTVSTPELEFAKARSKEIQAFKRMNYHDYLDYFLDLKTGRGTSVTQDGYYAAAKHIVNGLGNLMMYELTSDLIKKYFNNLKSKTGQATIDKIFIVIRTSLRHALQEEHIERDLMISVSKPKSDFLKSKEMEIYSKELLTLIRQEAEEYPELKYIFAVLEATGIRPGELRALKREDFVVNATQQYIMVQNAITKVIKQDKIGKKHLSKTEVVGATKSSYSVREIPLSDECVAAISKWLTYVKTDKNYKLATNSKYLFTSRDGEFLSESELISRFKRFLKAQNLNGRGITFTRFRHTYATKLARKGVDIDILMRLMGDSSIDMVRKYYIHANYQDLANATNKLSA